MSSTIAPGSRVFISYSHADLQWLEQLRVHLKSLELAQVVLLDIWDDTRISAGEPWREQIEQAISSAKIAILLVSADFLASDFINREELPLLLAAARDHGLRIVPVILRPCRFAHHEALSSFQSVNPPDRPLSSLPEWQQERYWNQLAMDIAAIMGGSPGAGKPGAVVLPRGRGRRLAMVGGALVVGLAATTLHPVKQATAAGVAWIAHSLRHPDAGPALPPADWAALHRMRRQLRTAMASEVSKFVAHPRHYDPWNAAQVVVALDGKVAGEPAKVIEFFRSTELGDCGWPMPFSHQPPAQLGSTGWVMVALAHLDTPLRQEQYSCLLGLQSRDGWWPLFGTAKAQLDSASTYATVWLLLGFADHVERGLVPAELREQAAQALARGQAWLLQRRSNGSHPIHWSDYPARSVIDPAAAEAEQALTDQSVSALVLHCLHRLTPREDLLELDTAWLSWLPADLPMPTNSGKTDHWVELDQSDTPRAYDAMRHYRLPWFLVATLDAYPQGSVAQHVAVLRRLRAFSSQGDAWVSDAVRQPWVAAELLFSLNHVAERASQLE